MQIIFYNTVDDENVIGKTKTDELQLECTFKDVANIVEPEILVNSDTILLHNYCYIPDFKRYYFVTDTEIFPQNIYKIRLTCDVLESFKDDILRGTVKINKKIPVNKFYDSDYKSEVRKEIDIYKSDTTMIEEPTQILVTLGGV